MEIFTVTSRDVGGGLLRDDQRWHRAMAPQFHFRLPSLWYAGDNNETGSVVQNGA